MKRDPLDVAVIVMLVLLVVVGGPYALQKLRGPQPPEGSVAAERPAASQRRVTLKVEGMMCGNCVETIAGALNALPGVSGCEVDRERERAVVVCDRVLADSALIGAIERSDTLYTAQVARF